jgi:pSer/pThr/pTyr-binding forkhead associated (FHA) protein
MTQAIMQLIAPAIVAGLFGCASALVTSRLLAANERKKFERELLARQAEWERSFAMQYAQLAATNTPEAAAVRQQFAHAYLLLEDHSERFFIPASTRMVIGRVPQCDIVIDDEMASRTHAAIEGDDGDYWLTDLRSRAGTRLNGQPVCARSRLSDGDQLEFGGTKATFCLLGD